MPGRGPGPGNAAVPIRRLLAPLHYQRRLIEGWGNLPTSVRERWRELEQGPASFAPLFELGWFLCDGRRDLKAIAHGVWLETGRHEVRALREFFEWTSTLGLSRWLDRGEA
jgi:hypothetical protein